MQQGGGQRLSAAAAAARLDEQLRAVFNSFAHFGQDRAVTREAAAAAAAQPPTLDSAHFVKLCRDCGLLCPLVTKESVDVVFARAKGDPRARRLGFAQFRHALVLLAAVKYGGNPDGPFAMASQIVASAGAEGGGPQLDAVHLPETSHTIFEKLTDASLYTGSNKARFDAEGRGRGKEGRDRVSVGAGTVDAYAGGNVSDLSSIVRPNMRGGTHMSNFARLSSAALSGLSPPNAGSSPAAVARTIPASAVAAAGGAVSPVQRGKWGSPGAARAASARERASPSHSDDSADARPPTAWLPHWQARAEGDARGALVDYPGAGAGAGASAGGSPPAAAGAGAPAGGSGGGSGGSPSAGGRLQPPKVVIESPELEGIFRAYCGFGVSSRMVPELDSARFMKFCREVQLVDGRGVSTSTVDLVFAKVKAAAAAEEAAGGARGGLRGKRTINYSDFCQALAALAPLRHPGSELLNALQAVVETAILAGGPAVSTVSLMPSSDSVHARLADRRYFTTSAALHEARDYAGAESAAAAAGGGGGGSR